MIAFEVLVNGEKLCTAGVGDKGVLTANIVGPKSPRLRVGGLHNEEHVLWISHRPMALELKVGDEVTVRIVETEVVDEPIQRYASQTRAEREDKVQGHLERASDLLPTTVDLREYRESFAQRNWLIAMDALESMGNASGAGAEFWKALCDAAHSQMAYEDRDRHIKKWKALEAAESKKE